MKACWHAFTARLKIDHPMTITNRPEADGPAQRTKSTLIQYLRLRVHENPYAWLDFLPCAEWVYITTMHSTTRCSPASLVYTEAPLSDPVLDLAVGNQPCSVAGEEFREHLRSARECTRKAEERHARHYKRRAAVIFEPVGLVLVEAHGPFAVHAPVTRWHTRWSCLQSGNIITVLTGDS